MYQVMCAKISIYIISFEAKGMLLTTENNQEIKKNLYLFIIDPYVSYTQRTNLKIITRKNNQEILQKWKNCK